MKRKLMIWCGIFVVCLLSINTAVAQDKNIRLVKGRKLILKGEVSDRAERKYIFKAKEGQSLTIKLIGRDAVFIITYGTAGSADDLTGESQSWSGKLPESDDDEYYIRLSSNYKVASYTLEITLK